MEFGTFLRRFGQNVRKARWIRGMTQQDLVAATGITYRYFQEIERGQRNPSLRLIHELAAVLKVRVADLLEVGERLAEIDLSATPAVAPKRGRKPKPKWLGKSAR